MNNKILIAMTSVALLAACSADPIESVSTVAPDANVGQNNTVVFANNTAMTIGTTGRTRAAGYSSSVDARPANDACDLQMPAEPTLPAAQEGAVVYTDNLPSNFQSWSNAIAGTAATGWQATPVDIVVPAGSTYDLNGSPVKKDIYVAGTLNVNSYSGQGGRIIVMPGGSVNYNMNGPIDRMTVVNYGQFLVANNDFTVNAGAAFYSTEALTLPGTLNVGGQVYIDEAVTAATINPYGGSDLRVGGALTLTSSQTTHLNNASNICVEGTFQAVNLSTNGVVNLHVGCKLYVTDQLSLHNGTQISTGYIKAGATDISGVQVYLPNGGVADLGELTIGSVSATNFYVVGNGNAMVSCTTGELLHGYSLDNVIGPELYFNYEHFYVYNGGREEVTVPGTTADGCHDITIGTDLVNAATINSKPAEGECCNPGFTPNASTTVPGGSDEPTTPSEPTTPADPTPGDNADGDIVIVIPDDIDDDWMLEADDFAIRINGQYVQETLTPVNNVVKLNGIQVSESDLKVTISGIQGNIEPDTEYTYETYLWVDYETWTNFTAAEQTAWIGGDGHGTDITADCTFTPIDGYDIRYNVYKGLAGHEDTPYIKVSVHITKK